MSRITYLCAVQVHASLSVWKMFFHSSSLGGGGSATKLVHWTNEREVTDLTGHLRFPAAFILAFCIHVWSLGYDYKENNGCSWMLNEKKQTGTARREPAWRINAKNFESNAILHVYVCVYESEHIFTFDKLEHYHICLWPHRQNTKKKKKKAHKTCLNTKQVVEIHQCHFINAGKPLKYGAIRAATEIRMWKKAISESKI